MKPVYRVTAPVSLVGLAVLAWLAFHPERSVGPDPTAALLLLGPGVLIGELAPLRIPRRGDDEEITFSTTFAFALLLSAGALPACVALCAASTVQDLMSKKPAWRVLFNIGQYTLSVAAGALVLSWLSGVPHAAATATFGTRDLPGILLAAFAMFAANMGIVGAAIALYQGVPVRIYMRRNFGFAATTGMVLLCLAPIVVAAMEFSWALVPLFVFPTLAFYQAGRISAARAHHQAMHDPLTGLPSRALLQTLLGEALNASRPGGSLFALMLLDLDRFKEVNDTLGHQHGDRLLCEVGPRLSQVVRPGDSVARLGGDEFVVLAGGLRSADEAREMANRLREAVRRPFRVDDVRLEVDVSIGIAMAPEHGTDVEQLLKCADVAMYEAKGRNLGAAVYSPQRDPHSTSRLGVVPELRRAIAEDGLALVYQPQVDAADRQVRYVEALVRWPHSSRGLVPPSEFVPLAEASGLIKPLTSWVLERALRQRQHWLNAGLDLGVSVNVSSRSLLDEQFPEEIAEALARTGVPATRLQLEITESSVMTDPEAATALLQRIADTGVSIAIDDFGTGFSSFTQLKELPAAVIKIDRSFVLNMLTNSRDALIVRSIIDLAGNLGLLAVAEGVEDEQTLEALIAMGCQRIQGYHLGRPMEALEIPALYPAFAPGPVLTRLVA